MALISYPAKRDDGFGPSPLPTGRKALDYLR